ncbi:MAG: hypothetical protein Q7T20_04050 [Saprospiraceae bacterium]|nr:hypothetical protein [Saprospiraceae bacterium]
MKKSFFVLAATMVLVIASLWFISCEKEKNDEPITVTNQVEDRGNEPSKVFLPFENPYGQSYTNWTVSWMQRFMGFNCDKNPFVNPDNALFYQKGQVYFLAGLSTEGDAIKLTVPQGKAILFSLVNYINKYPCPNQPMEPKPGQSLEHFLRAGALKTLADVQGLSVEIDGVPISHLEAYQFTSRLFSFTGNPELASCLDVCVTGRPQKAVTSGFYLMLKPMSKGLHTLHYRAEIPSINAAQNGTYYITVI